MKIIENYDSHTKEELLSEIHDRGIDGITMPATKSDMIAALALDDETAPESPIPGTPKAPDFKNEPEQPPAPLPPLKASPIPQVESDPVTETGIDACAIPPDEEFTDGIYINKDDKMKYALCKHPPDGYGRTHSLKNSKKTWQGNAAEFNATFEKE